MNTSDRIRIQHMLDAAAEAAAFIEGRSLEHLLRDRALLLALGKEIEIIGEAATQLSQELRQSCPEIPWNEIRGMRNRLIHAYSELNVRVVWTTITSDLPELVTKLKILLGDDK